MDGALPVQDEAALRQICVTAGATQLLTFLDPHRNVVYGEITYVVPG